MHQVPAHLWYRTGRAARRTHADHPPAVPPAVPVAGSAKRAAEPPVTLKPLGFDARSANELRPASFAQMVGQDRLRALLGRIVANCRASGRPLDHILLAGQSGTGKTTLGQVTAHELGAAVYQVKAPVTHAVLRAAQRQLRDGDVLIVDEVHQQVHGDRRGVTQAADPEDFYHVLEDRVLPTENAMLPFPAITMIACTTDEGLLPEAFLGRFPLRLALDPYTVNDMRSLAFANSRQLRVLCYRDAADIFALASRRNPRVLNAYMRNAVALAPFIDADVAREVVQALNGCTADGLTPGMQAMLRCLLRSRRIDRQGNEVYQASVNTVATMLGHSRDTKAVQLFVEPYLIGEGYVQVTHGGRQLTPTGIERARQLCP